MDWLFKALGYLGASLGVALVSKVLLSKKTKNREILGITLILTATMMILDYFDMVIIQNGLEEGIGLALGTNMTDQQRGGMDDSLAVEYWTTGDAHGLPMDTCERKDFEAGYPLTLNSKAKAEPKNNLNMDFNVNEPDEGNNNIGQMSQMRREDDLNCLFVHGGRLDNPHEQNGGSCNCGDDLELEGLINSTVSGRASVPNDLHMANFDSESKGVAIGKYVRSDVPVILKNFSNKITQEQTLVNDEDKVKWSIVEDLNREPLFRLRFLTGSPRGSPIRNGTNVYLVWTNNDGEISYIGDKNTEDCFTTSTFSNSNYLWTVETTDDRELIEYGDVITLKSSNSNNNIRVKVDKLKGCGPLYRLTG